VEWHGITWDGMHSCMWKTLSIKSEKKREEYNWTGPTGMSWQQQCSYSNGTVQWLDVMLLTWTGTGQTDR